MKDEDIYRLATCFLMWAILSLLLLLYAVAGKVILEGLLSDTIWRQAACLLWIFVGTTITLLTIVKCSPTLRDILFPFAKDWEDEKNAKEESK